MPMHVVKTNLCELFDPKAVHDNHNTKNWPTHKARYIEPGQVLGVVQLMWHIVVLICNFLYEIIDLDTLNLVIRLEYMQIILHII